MTGRRDQGRKSGLDQIPPIVSRPVWKDRIFWIGLATAAFWILVIWYFLFR